MPDIIVKVGAFVLLLGGLIFVHELGHFVVAKLLGVKVLRFSIGFGPRLFGFTRGETEYRIAALPLGGYVKMAGDDPAAEVAPEDRGRGFLEQAPWRRLAIAFAGPLANLVFPGVVFLAIFLSENGAMVPAPVIGSVAPGSPAEEAGLRPGDLIRSIAAPGGSPVPVRYEGDVRALVAPHPGEPLTLQIERDGVALPPVRLVPAMVEDTNVLETTRRGLIGIGLGSYAVAAVAPPVPGAAGPLQPFDVVLSAGGRPVRHMADLERALAAASCGPLDLEVLREQAVAMPGAALADYEPVKLPGVPTCDAEGRRLVLPATPSLSTFVASVVPGSPAQKAGLRRGDAITAVNGKRTRTFMDLNTVARDFLTGKPVALSLADGRTLSLLPASESYQDELTRERKERVSIGLAPLGRTPVDPAQLRVPQVALVRGPGEIASLAFTALADTVRVTVLGISRIFTGQLSFKTVGGPIMLFQLASSAAEEGIGSLVLLMAAISVNLGLMNLLPIPVLDGGHIVTALLESVTRRPLSMRAREIANVVGLVLLFTLMVFVFKNDIVRVLG
jgi:regulator of sigma E protease